MCVDCISIFVSLLLLVLFCKKFQQERKMQLFYSQNLVTIQSPSAVSNTQLNNPFYRMWVLISVNVFCGIISLTETVILYSQAECNFSSVNFFLYLEDIDLCKRLIKNNENIFLLNTSIAQHVSGQSSSSKNYILIRYFHFGWSLIYYYKKHFGIIVSILVSFWYFFKINIKTFLYFLLSKNIFAENKSMLQGVFSSFFCKKDFFRNKY